jgi:hypothetical protein
MRSIQLVMLMLSTLVSSHACRAAGFSDDVLWRVSSPDGQMVAVCQEVPEFDGPGFAVRLERPDGSPLKRLYEIGDADGCSEVVWSPDSRTLAVLTAHLARVRLVDVEWALENPTTESAYWSSRQVSFSSEQQPVLGANLRFTGPIELELDVCQYHPGDARRTAKGDCADPSTIKRFSVPVPIDGVSRSANRRGRVTREHPTLVIE